jgi:uncharacterized membrane protein
MEKTTKAIFFFGFVVLVLWTGTAFASTQDVVWQTDHWRLLVGTLAMSLATLYTLIQLDGKRVAVRFMLSTMLISWLAEAVGLQGNWLFGGVYDYHVDVQLLLPGGVPFFIPLAWFVLAGLPVMFLRSWPTRAADGSLKLRSLALKCALAAWGVMACDLALDPIAVSVGLWTWEGSGGYFGIPLLNFAGWWVVAFVVYAVGYSWAGLGRGAHRPISIRYDVVWGLAHGLLLLLLGVAAHARLGSTLPVWLALLAISPLSLCWLNEVIWKIKTRRRSRKAVAEENSNGSEP